MPETPDADTRPLPDLDLITPSPRRTWRDTIAELVFCVVIAGWFGLAIEDTEYYAWQRFAWTVLVLWGVYKFGEFRGTNNR